jgi:pimeloyl-ACP methyl ester carboxylesterase
MGTPDGLSCRGRRNTYGFTEPHARGSLHDRARIPELLSSGASLIVEESGREWTNFLPRTAWEMPNKEGQSSEDNPCPKVDVTHRYISVPLMYAHPELGNFQLYYETNSDFNPLKKTLFVLHDGQQHVSAAGTPDEYKKKYQLDMNVVCMEHRGMPCSRVQYVFTENGVDWRKAYDVFRSENVVEDIDRIRVDLLGGNGKIFLWGRSGGGILACQYLAGHSQYVDRASILVSSDNTQSTVLGQRANFFLMLEREGMMQAYLEILKSPPVPEIEFLWILQRLGYDFLPSEKKQIQFIRSLREGDMSLYRAYVKKYNNVEEFMGRIQRQTPFSTIRIYELFFHALDLVSPKDPTYGLFEPNARPLRGLVEKGDILPKITNVRKALAAIGTEVLLVAARWDNIFPYEEMVNMNKNILHSRLVILDDLHMTIKTDAFLSQLIKAFFKNGAFSPEFDRLLVSNETSLWR